MPAFARCLAVASFGAITGCGGGDAPLEPVPLGSDALTLTAQVSKDIFERGDFTVITVTLRNISSRTVRVRFLTTCTIVYAIRNAGGAIVVPSGGSWLCQPAISFIDLAPSQATQRTFEWAGDGLPAGNYVVYGVRGETMTDSSDGVAVELVETPVEDLGVPKGKSEVVGRQWSVISGPCFTEVRPGRNGTTED